MLNFCSSFYIYIILFFFLYLHLYYIYIFYIYIIYFRTKLYKKEKKKKEYIRYIDLILNRVSLSTKNYGTKLALHERYESVREICRRTNVLFRKRYFGNCCLNVDILERESSSVNSNPSLTYLFEKRP